MGTCVARASSLGGSNEIRSPETRRCAVDDGGAIVDVVELVE